VVDGGSSQSVEEGAAPPAVLYWLNWSAPASTVSRRITSLRSAPIWPAATVRALGQDV
jgi:hypothetical protein